MKPIIIVGSGMAGISVAREYRKLDSDTPIMILTNDDGGFYAKPNLSNAFAQQKLAAQLKSQSASQLAEQLKLNVLQHTKLIAIDSEKQSITTSIGSFEYHRLVLALGAEAIKLPIAGNAQDQILSINHLNDYTQFREHLGAVVSKNGNARIALMGAGLIGCEFADDLIGAGFEVHLIDPNPLPLAALLPEPISTQLYNALTSQGVNMHLGTSAAQIDSIDNRYRLQLLNGETIECDIVLSAIGLRPQTQIARQCMPQAMTVDRGIVVDRFGETSVKNIFALGDCAQYTLDGDGTSAVLPYIAPILTAARAIAKTLNGDISAIEMQASPVIVKTPSCPIALIAPSVAERNDGSWSYELNPEQIHISRFHNSAGKLRGFAITPQDAKLRTALTKEMST